MARARSPARDKAYEIYKKSKGKKLLKDIAAELEVSDTQIRKWKNQDKWDDLIKGNVTNDKGNVTNRKSSTNGSDDKGTFDGRKSSKKEKTGKRRSGNPNPSHRFPKHNSFPSKHGLFSKFLHEEQVEIIEVMRDLTFADQLWFQIELKFSAIIRMQKIMWVDDADDHLKEESGSSWGMGGSESFKVSFAYERFETYIKAQARAMAEYRNLVKQYIELTDEFDERRLKLDQMQLGIERTKAEITKLRGEDKEEFENDGFLEALNGKVEEIWSDDDEQDS